MREAALLKIQVNLGKLFKSTLNNRLCSNLACVIDESYRGVKLKRAFEELPLVCLLSEQFNMAMIEYCIIGELMCALRREYMKRLERQGRCK